MLLKSSAYTFAGTLVQFVASIASGMLIARLLGPSGKGQVFLVVQYASLGSLVCSIGMGASYLYHIKKALITYCDAVAHALAHVTMTAAILVALYIWARPVLSRIAGGHLSDVMICLLLASIVVNLFGLYSGNILMGFSDGLQKGAVISMIGAMVYVAALVLLVWWMKLGPVGAVIAALAPVVLRIVLSSLIIVRRVGMGIRAEAFRNTMALARYGIGSFAGNVMMTMASRIDTFIINMYVEPRDLGLYSVAVSLAELTLMIPSSIGVALFPHLTGQPDKDRIATASLIARLSACLGIGSLVVLTVLGYPIIRLMFGRQFLEAYIPLIALLPGLAALTTAYSYANYFSSIGKPVVNAWIFGIGLIVNIAGNFVVVPHFGIIGAGFVTSLGYICVMIGFVLQISHTARVSWRSVIIPRRSDIALVALRIRSFAAHRGLIECVA